MRWGAAVGHPHVPDAASAAVSTRDVLLAATGEAAGATCTETRTLTRAMSRYALAGDGSDMAQDCGKHAGVGSGRPGTVAEMKRRDLGRTGLGGGAHGQAGATWRAW